MLIKDVFERDINRNIRGVITVNEEEELIYQELDEYVVTKDINKNLTEFYNQYIKSFERPTQDVGVWISGFYGSGKSHFLKILSYLLENKEAKGKNALEFFNSKIENEILLADIEKIANTPKDVIIFNIDSESDADDKEHSLLKVFRKMFYKKLGLDASNKTIFELEKYLFENKKFEDFKNEYNKKMNRDWETDGRRLFLFEQSEVKEIFSQVIEMTEENKEKFNFEDLKTEETISSFAEEIKNYIKNKNSNHHVLFLVDEVGQYIADNKNLILNLQTLSEELGNKCQGKAWIIVTSQEELQDLASKNMTDFSRIQARYKTRLNFSSISVGEVINKRLLIKKKEAEETLKIIYENHNQSMKNIILFNNSSSTYKGFNNETEYINSYPFIPYQIKLIQKVFEDIRKNSISGRYLSEGERSLLSAYQESAIKHQNENLEILVPFYSFYDTIKNFLTSKIVRVIEGAEEKVLTKDLEQLDINLLKTLFLIRYVEDFEKNIENITTLMISKIEEDKALLRQKIKTALTKLEKEALISKNADQYYFLTDEEQEINKRIKNILIEESEILKEIKELIFDEIYKGNQKIEYNKSKSFFFNIKIDETAITNRKDSQLNVQVLTPYSKNYYDENTNALFALSMANKDHLIIKLKDMEFIINEMKEYMQIKKFAHDAAIKALPETSKKIINNKYEEVSTRKKRVLEEIKDSIKISEFYFQGNEIKESGTAEEKLKNSFKEFIKRIFTYIDLIKPVDVKDLLFIIKEDNAELFEDEYKNNEAVKNMKNYLLNTSSNLIKTVKDILIYFSKIPYGWSNEETISILLILYKKREIEFVQYSELLEIENNDDIMKLMNKENENIIVQKVEDLSQKAKVAKEIISELFNSPDAGTTAKETAKKLLFLIKEKLNKLRNYIEQAEERKFPGLKILTAGEQLLEEFEHLNESNTKKIIEAAIKLKDSLLDWKEDYEAVDNFFKGSQKTIFEEAIILINEFKEYENYIKDESTKQNLLNLIEIIKHESPYRRIQEIPLLKSQLISAKEEILKEEKQNLIDKTNKIFDEIENYSNQAFVEIKTKDSIKERKNYYIQKISNENNISRVKATFYDIDREKDDLRKKIEENIKNANEENKKINPDDSIYDEKDPKSPPKINEPKTKMNFVKKIYAKELIQVKKIKTEEDVEALITELRKYISQNLKENTEIEIID
jgi:hypothetical protein